MSEKEGKPEGRKRNISTELLMGETVKVIVGTEGETFHVHKALICQTSPYFNAAFQSSFKETNDCTINLLDVQPEIFALFQKWLYTDILWNSDTDQAAPNQYQLIRLYVFADMIMLPSLQNRVMRALESERHVSHKICVAKLDEIWDNTTDESPLRRYMVDIIVWTLNVKCFTVANFGCRREICLAIMQRFSIRNDPSTKTSLSTKTSPLTNMSNYYVSESEAAIKKE